MSEPDLITTSEVAAILRVDTSAVRRWVATKKLIPAAATPGGHYRFHRVDIEAFITEATSTG